MFTKRLLFVLMIAALIVPALAITPFAGAQEGPKPEAVGLRPDAPPYALHGPYWVGTREFVIEPEFRTPTGVTVWYPALNPEGMAEEVAYAVDYPPLVPGPQFVSGHAILDAAPNAENVPYPLIINSHGHWGYRLGYPWFTEHLASYGFIIIAVDHFGDTLTDVPRGLNYEVYYGLRPFDVRRVIDYAETLNTDGGALAGLIDLEHIAVSGHSQGGYTVLAAGGAQWDVGAFKSWCDMHGSTDPLDDCRQILDHLDELAALQGLEAVPSGLWPATADPRIDAVVAFAPETRIFGEAGMEAIRIPTMVLLGSNDTILPPELSTFSAYEHLGSSQKALVVFEGADHLVFHNPCRAGSWTLAPEWFAYCSDPVWDMDRAHDLINHFTTAFLLATLKGDQDAAAALASDAVTFPGITYETTGF